MRSYVLAIELGLARLPELPLSLRRVRELHARLMQGTRGGDKSPGQFRTHQNYIGTALGNGGARIDTAA